MSRNSETQEPLRGALSTLLPNPNFRQFIDALRELREGAVMYAVSHTAVKDQRETLAALGEVRAYSDIIDIVDSYESGKSNEEP